MEISENKPQPFLRWAGGKRWFIKHLEYIGLDVSFDNYHEPFLGSGVLFLHFNPRNLSYLSDLNSELIETYIAIKEDVETVITELGKFRNTEQEYYKVRNNKFRSSSKRAARFIYLNHTSFNGIYRVNKEGKYNVPYGHRQKTIYEPENLRQISKSLSKAIINSADFEICKKVIKKNDLIFLDPPYTVTHNNNGFIKYNQKLFSLDDQYRLSSMIDFIKKKGAYYILTNAAHKEVEKIFEKGDKKIKLIRLSLVGGLHAKRDKFEEVMFTNIV